MTTEAEAIPSSNAASWLVLSILALCLAVLELIGPVPITLKGLVPLAIACTTLGAVCHYYRTIRPCVEFAEMCVALAQVLLFSAIGIALSYLVARWNYPLWDATLAGWDRSLGFDWMAAMRLVDRSALLTAVLAFAYASLIPQIVVVVCGLGFKGRITQLRTVILAAMLCGSICIFISAFTPAVAYGVFLHVHPGDFQRVFPWAGFVQIPDFEALRAGTIAKLDFAAMQGIITFPSYHAGLSTITFWGFIETRSKWLRIPGAALATLTIIATPIDGGHYFVDVIAGMAIGAACLAAARRAIHFNPSSRAITALPFRRSREAFAR
jgi:membrane-associated phospholipid phosphatase